MKTIFDLINEVSEIRRSNADIRGVEYYCRSNPSVRHYVIVRNDQELTNLKELYKDWDFAFNLINC